MDAPGARFKCCSGAARDPPGAAQPRLLIAGATGVLGNEVLRRLVGLRRFGATQVLAREPITAGLRGVRLTVVAGGDAGAPGRAAAADTGVVLFEPPRLFHDRERALWTPQPEQLLAVARWMRAQRRAHAGGGAAARAGRLPEALKRGLASLDEQAVAAWASSGC